MPGRNANANPNFDTGKSDANSYSNCYISSGKPDANAYSYSDDATSVAHAHSDCDGDNHAEAYAYAKATAHAVPASDAVSEWAKKLKELKSYRELARPCPDRYAKRCGRGNSRVLALWWIDFFQGDGNRVAGGASYRQQAAIAFANTLRTTRSICAFGKPK